MVTLGTSSQKCKPQHSTARHSSLRHLSQPAENLQPSSHRRALCKAFVGLGKKALGCLCFFYHLMFCRYLRLESSECPQLLCNPRNEDIGILPARACCQDFKEPGEKRAQPSLWELPPARQCWARPSSGRECPRRDGISPRGMKHLPVTEQTLS